MNEGGLMVYVYLVIAILFEVTGTMLLPISQQFTKLLPTLGLITAYVLSFYFLSLSLKTLPIAVVYATWSGLGVLLIAVFGYFVFNQALQWQTIVGLVLIVVGVTLVNTYAKTH